MKTASLPGGEEDWRLKDAMKRGDYHVAKEIMCMGPD
jgi:NADH dehydrogenase (ubiquinone) flavoprotein 1